MKKILLILASLSGFVFADCSSGSCFADISICGYGDDGEGGAFFNVCYSTDYDVAGFQFNFDDVSGGGDFVISSVTGGAAAAAGFTTQAGGTTILGFSFSGATVPSGSGLLIVIGGTYTGSGNTLISATNPVFTPTVTIDEQNVVYSTTGQSWDAGLLNNGLPGEYKLSSAYPNPFNPTTTIEYNVEIAGNVSLVVYDLMGREIKTLVNDFRAPRTGGYKVMWDGTNNDGSLVASGMYMYRMISNDFTKTYRLTLLK